MFSVPVISLKKSTEKIIDINSPAKVLFGFNSLQDVENKHIRFLIPNVVNLSNLYDEEISESIKTSSGAILRATIKFSLFEEGQHERILITLYPKIVARTKDRCSANLLLTSINELRVSLTHTSNHTPSRRVRTRKTESVDEDSSDVEELAPKPMGFFALLDLPDE